ncbi:MAG: GH32 C-terminal domain-containing protein [Bacteroidota bacterium]|nr:GH32 C-terminal domain-containing protein [Bacteroidota bacterium]
MKKIVLSFAFLFSLLLAKAEERIVYSQNFENATVGTEALDNVQVHNFNAGGGASWTYDLATDDQAISGNKSAHLTIQNAGDQWWGLQFKVEDAALSTVGKGLKYRISFKIKSSTDNNHFQFRMEGTSAFGQDITIPKANVVQEVTLESTPMEGTGTANFLWAFGYESNPGEIWIDDIVVTELYTPLNFSENFDHTTTTASTIGDFSLGNYEGSAWTFGVEPVGKDTTNKCVGLNITENSVDWWVLQYKVEKFPVIKDKQYIIKFKAKSGLPNLFNFRVEGTSDYMTMLTTKGGNGAFDEYTCETPPMQRSGVANFLWAFGKPTKPDKFYLDDISFQEKPVYADTTKISRLTLNDFTSDVHMTPAFNPTITNYNAIVPFNKESITFLPATDSLGEIFINDQAVRNGSSVNYPLAVGDNYVTIKVQDTVSNATIVYSFKIDRKADPASAYLENFRPQIHYTPERGWCNDPNGLVYYDGEYHFFHQYNPNSKWWGVYNSYISRWQPVYWGHAISKDLVHWEEYPIALYPDNYGSMWSGSAVVDENNTTGLFSTLPEKKGLVIIYSTAAAGTAQSMAYSLDKGRTWLKYNDGKPVVAQSQDPANNPGDFRDPKVFWHEESGKWMMVVAGGPLRFFSSPNLIDWTAESSYQASLSVDGKTIDPITTECPDFFRLPVENTTETKWVLSGGGKFYMIGDFKAVDGKWYFIPDDNNARPVMNFGPDFYATQTYSNEKTGRRIATSWISNGQYQADLGNVTDPYNGTYTLNYELKLKKNTAGNIGLYQTPVKEYESLRGIPRDISDYTLVPDGPNPLSYLQRSLYEIEAEFTPDNNTTRVGFKLRTGTTQQTLVYYDYTTKTICIDRGTSGIIPNNNFLSTYSQKVDPASDGKIKMHIFVDWSTIEVFVNDGEAAGVAYIFPDAASNNASVYTEGGKAVVTMKEYPLKRIWSDSGETLDDSDHTTSLSLDNQHTVKVVGREGLLTIENVGDKNATAQLFSIKGNLLKTVQLMSDNTTHLNLKTGFYLVKVTNDKQTTVYKVVL